MSLYREPAEGILIAARGEGTRLRETMTRFGAPEHFPKHLLPTGGPNGETLLGRIVRQAAAAPVNAAPIIHANQFSARYMIEHPDIDDNVEIRMAPKSSNSMDLYLQALTRYRQRVMGSAGDFYATFSWQDMLDHHESQTKPVTFLVGRTTVKEEAAVYHVNDRGSIKGIERRTPTDDDLINVGVYIFDATKRVREIAEALLTGGAGDEGDPLGTSLIDSNLLGAYVVEDVVFNINRPGSLEDLHRHTTTMNPDVAKAS